MSDTSGLTNFIKEAISSYLGSNIDFGSHLADLPLDEWSSQKKEMTVSEFLDSIRDDVNYEIEEHLDVDALSKLISEAILSRSFTFNAFPKIEGTRETGFRTAGEYSCPHCFRAHGEWKSSVGQSFDPNILSNGRTIVILDDF